MNEKLKKWSAATIEINPGFHETYCHLDHRFKSQSFRRYRMKWDDYPKYDIVDKVPIHLDLETTARCQLKCPGCPSMKLVYDKGDMPIGVAIDAIKEFAEKGGSSVKFNWRGEPTLYKDLPTLVSTATMMGLQDKMMNTNGVSLTPELSMDLVMRGINMVAFSIDSVDRERYAKLRPGANLDKVTKNLRAFLRYAEQVDSICVRVQRIEYPDEPMSHDEFADFFIHEFPRVNYVASNSYKVKELDGDVSRASNPCAQLWQRLVMTYDGWMGPCCEFNRFGEDTFGQFPTTSIESVWTSSILGNLRRKHRLCEQNEIDACAHCTVTKPKCGVLR